MTVVGVLKANGESASGSNDNQILIPYTLAQRLSNSTGISSFYVSAASSDQVTQAQTAVEAYLEKSLRATIPAASARSTACTTRRKCSPP